MTAIAMRALTLTQPWASLVVLGAKQVETRSWRTDYTGPLAIHAGKGLRPAGGKDGLWRICGAEPFTTALAPLGGMYASSHLPRGFIVAVCEVAWCLPVEEVRDRLIPWTRDPIAERAFGDYSDGRFAWGLSGIRRLDDPVPCRGALGLWQVPEEVVRAIV